MILFKILEKSVFKGRLNVHLPDGQVGSFGSGKPIVDWHIHDRRAISRIARDPELALGESYVAGEWSVAGGDLAGLLEILMRNFPERPVRSRTLALVQQAWQQLNRIASSYRNVAHHYDLDETVFRSFLDPDMQYSCAYFQHAGMSLEYAQQAKCQHIMKKLLIQPGNTVLDIGCGWGGLALYLASHCDATITGITLSREQLRIARERARSLGVQDRVEFRLEDYREHRGDYDRIVSVGMFEHVGRPFYGRFFSHIGDLLKEDGVALLHSIGRTGPPGSTNAWIRKYIFPGGYCPALSELSAAIEKTGIVTTDIEVLRLHYADTLGYWQRRFQAHRDEIADQLDERFCRMWEFYLAVCEAAFRWWDLVVYQVQLAHCNDAVPTTRDYLYAASEGVAVPARLRQVQ